MFDIQVIPPHVVLRRTKTIKLISLAASRRHPIISRHFSCPIPKVTSRASSPEKLKNAQNILTAQYCI